MIKNGGYIFVNTIFFTFFIIQLVSCQKEQEFNENQIIKAKIEAFNILNDNHHLLHEMLGSDKEKGLIAFNNFKREILKVNNAELIPIVNSFNRIKKYAEEYENIQSLDELVDYYQSGLSIQIESIFKGYGVKRIIPNDSALIVYNKLILNN